MARALPVELRTRVLAALAEGMTFRAAAATFDVGLATVVRWRRLEREQSHLRPKRPGGNRRPVYIEDERDTVLGLLEENPDMPIEALRAALGERGLVFSYGTVQSFLKRHGFRRKRGRRPRTAPQPPDGRGYCKSGAQGG